MPMDEQTCLKKLRSKSEFIQGPAWQEQRKAALLWRACCEAVAARDRARLSTWRQAMDEAQGFITATYPVLGNQHVRAAFGYLACAELALEAALLREEYTVEALIPLLHAAAGIVTVSCDHDVDHGLLYTALETQQSRIATDAHAGRQDTPEQALTPIHAVDMVFNILASKAYGPARPVTRAWAWEVTRTLLGTKRREVSGCAVTVAGTTTADHGVLSTLTLDVLEPGSGEVFHDPQAAFHTYADDYFLASMQKAWDGAWHRVQAQEGAKRTWDGRWSLRQGRERESPPVPVVNGSSGSGAAARGWWHALRGMVPDDGVIVIVQVDAVDQDGVMQLTGVDDRGVFVKTQAIAQDPRFDTIVVANKQDEAAALQALGNAPYIRVLNLAKCPIS